VQTRALIHRETLRLVSPSSQSLHTLGQPVMYVFSSSKCTPYFLISPVICFYNPVRFNIVSFLAMFVLAQENRSLSARVFSMFWLIYFVLKDSAPQFDASLHSATGMQMSAKFRSAYRSVPTGCTSVFKISHVSLYCRTDESKTRGTGQSVAWGISPPPFSSKAVPVMLG
jgi:hypothetical protein